MTLLRIAAQGDSAQHALGDPPVTGPEHRLILDPALTLAAAASAIRLALRDSSAPWVIATGPAVAPFLVAVGADLSLGVAGAFLLSPRPWAGRPLELAPLPFPSVLIAPLPDATAKERAKAWGAALIGTETDLFAQPEVRALIDRRSRDLARAAGPRPVGPAYAATGASG